MRTLKTLMLFALLALPLSAAWAATVPVTAVPTSLTANGTSTSAIQAIYAPWGVGTNVTFSIAPPALGSFPGGGIVATTAGGTADIVFTAGATVGVGTITVDDGAGNTGTVFVTLNKDVLTVNISVTILQAVEVNFDDGTTEATTRSWTFSAPLGTQVTTPPPNVPQNTLGADANINVENKTVGVAVDLLAQVTAKGNWGPVITPAAWGGAPAVNEFAVEANVDAAGFTALQGPTGDGGAPVLVKNALAAGATTATFLLKFYTPKSVTTITSSTITVTITATLN